jgi:hypothetical protein
MEEQSAEQHSTTPSAPGQESSVVEETVERSVVTDEPEAARVEQQETYREETKSAELPQSAPGQPVEQTTTTTETTTTEQ